MVTFSAAAADEGSVWWLWVVGGLAVWSVVAVLFAVILGRGIRLADRRSLGVGLDDLLTTADLPASLRAAPAAASANVRRRSIPVPPIGILLFAIAVTLETVGYILRLTGVGGASAQVLSMDAPFSVPRMFVAAVFAAAALAAVAGAGSLPGRRTWWLAVGLVGGVIAAVKAGSTVHAEALEALSQAIGGSAAVAVSGAVAAVVVGALWFLSC